jgi:hypothetical protein
MENKYDENMWTEEHAKQISSTLKSAMPLIYIIVGILCITFIGLLYGVINAIFCS